VARLDQLVNVASNFPPIRQLTRMSAKTTHHAPTGGAAAELIAVIVAVPHGDPMVMTVEAGDALPSGPFEVAHRSLQSGLRAWVEQRTGHALGYLEQLYTFADRERGEGFWAERRISISYLGLTRAEAEATAVAGASWRRWYDYFPWEDRRQPAAQSLEAWLDPQLKRWIGAGGSPSTKESRLTRAEIAFGLNGRRWNEELALQRYELLYEAGLAPEANPPGRSRDEFDRAMVADHRRILATGIARLRAKIKYNPVVFELMPPAFTLLQLQRCVEAIAGMNLHKPNFRRLIEQQQLVEETGDVVVETGGRPAKAFRFREAVKEERAVAGTKLPIARA
jgi:hypothetical protein